jgi:hypothetical protein
MLVSKHTPYGGKLETSGNETENEIVSTPQLAILKGKTANLGNEADTSKGNK